jgi:hypothetical protein
MRRVKFSINAKLNAIKLRLNAIKEDITIGFEIEKL